MEAVLFDAFILAVIVLLYRWARTRKDPGVFSRPGSRDYPYWLGDNMYFGGGLTGKYHGIEIDLPDALPHIYLDASRKQGFRGPRMFISPVQKIQLEGDFNTFFTAYVVQGYETLALSILTPDILQTLITYANGMDVEICHNKLRIISNRRVWHRPDRDEPLIKAAEKLLGEVDHKLRSWSQADAEQATETRLSMQDVPSMRLFGRNVRLSTVVISCTWGPISIPVWLTVYSDYHSGYYRLANSLPGDILFASFFFPGIFALLLIAVPRGWLRKLADTYIKP